MIYSHRSGGDRATDAAFTLYDGDTAMYVRTLNQQAAPVGVTLGGVTWQSLGYFKAGAGALAVELTGTWNTAPGGGSYNNSYRFNAAGTGADKASWTFDGLTSGKTYHVMASFRSQAAQASNAPFTIYDGATALETVLVNQRLVPNDVVFNSINFESLGYFVIHNGVLKVELTDNATGGAVVADAIRVVEVTEDPYIIDNGDSVGDATYSETGAGWSSSSDVAAHGGAYRERKLAPRSAAFPSKPPPGSAGSFRLRYRRPSIEVHLPGAARVVVSGQNPESVRTEGLRPWQRSNPDYA